MVHTDRPMQPQTSPPSEPTGGSPAWGLDIRSHQASPLRPRRQARSAGRRVMNFPEVGSEDCSAVVRVSSCHHDFASTAKGRTMHCMRPVRLLAVLTALVALIIPVSHQAAADDPIFLEWSSLLPGLVDEYQPSSANDCVAGRPHCGDATIREGERRCRSLGPAWDHNAVFALAYLRTTQTYKWARDQSGFFTDTPWVNHEDAVFAKYYFAAYDNWAGGARGQVPQAWL